MTARRARLTWTIWVVMGLGLGVGWRGAWASEGPSFDCGRVESGGIEAMICADPDLAALDRKLADVYAHASTRARDEQTPVL